MTAPSSLILVPCLVQVTMGLLLAREDLSHSLRYMSLALLLSSVLLVAFLYFRLHRAYLRRVAESGARH